MKTPAYHKISIPKTYLFAAALPALRLKTWLCLAALLLALIPLPRAAATTLTGNGLNVNIDDAGGTIDALQYNGSEYFQIGFYTSDWGIQTGTNTATFVHNTAEDTDGQAMSLKSYTPGSSVSYAGTYTAGGANVALTRRYFLVPGTSVLRTSVGYTNNGSSSITLRVFETFDPDSTADTNTNNSRFTIGSAYVGQAVRSDGSTFILGSQMSGEVIGASLFNYEGIQTGDNLNSLFTAGGANSNGANVDDSIDAAFQITLAAGASVSFDIDQAYGASATTAQANFGVAALTDAVPEPATWATLLTGGGCLLAVRRRGKRPGTPVSPRA